MKHSSIRGGVSHPLSSRFARISFVLAVLLASAAPVSVSADETPLAWNGADGGRWDATELNWLAGETPTAWTDGASASFGADASVSLAGTVVASNVTAAGTLSVNGVHVSTYTPFLTTTSKLVFPGLALDDIKAIQVDMGGRSIRSGAYTLPGTAYHIHRNGNKASVQFQCKNGDNLLCVRGELEEKTDGVWAKAVSACYIANWSMGSDFDNASPTSWSVATSLTTAGYGVCNLRASTAVLRLEGEGAFAGDLTISNAVLEVTAPGEQTWEHFLASTNGGGLAVRGISGRTAERTFGITDSSVSGANAAWLASARTLPGVILARSTPVSAVMRGKSIGFNADALPYQVKFDEATETLTCQFQFFVASSSIGPYIKGATVEFKQDGTNVTARAVKAYLWLGSNGATAETLGCDLEAEQKTRGTSVIQTYNVTDYGVKSFVLRCDDIPVLRRGNNTVGRDVEVDNAQLVFIAGAARPNGRITARNGARVIYCTDGASGNNEGMGCVRLFESGSSLTAYSSMCSEEKAHFIFDDAMLYTPVQHATVKDGRNYFNKVTLRNGARLYGYPLRCGTVGNHLSMPFVSEGTNANLIASGFCLVNNRKSDADDNTLALTTTADLAVTGNMHDFVQGADVLTGTRVTKNGAAKLTLSGANTFIGRFTVEAGTLALASGTALPPTAPMTWKNCTVTCGGVTNATGALTLSGNVALALGDGALAFADSNGEEWTAGATLAVTGDGPLPTKALRFGTSSEGLTPAQMRQVTYNGEPVSLDSQGYLRHVGGIFISIR